MDDEFEGFHDALERPPGERRAFLEERYRDRPTLVARVLKLVEAHEDAEAEGSAIAPGAGIQAEGITAPLREIGPYRVLELIGEGGMGHVYSAEQLEPIRRRVAIKVLRLGLDTPSQLARFEAERQALALLEHPGIATVFDAGVTDQGRPYFVMELVKGQSIVRYAEAHRLPLRDRLKIFCGVCEAVQHAHQRGIIHRDLKPSNVLVALQGGRPEPKVIDFGVAKSTASQLTAQPLFTEQGQLIGTPEYMSPEQAEMSGLDVDTRTDVYSLGVILYELLTGALPLDSKRLRAGGYSETLRVIREVEPALPSVRLAGQEAEALEGGSPVQAREVRGELDWIVMRALEKDRTRRYRSPIEFSEDIGRHLRDLPVEAGPPSLSYRVRKYVKRRRLSTALMGLVMLSAVAGVAGLSAGLLRARAAEGLATRRAEHAQAAADFLKEVLFQADPESGQGSMTLLEAMDSAGAVLQEELGNYPEVEASVRESLGVAYRRRSMFREAAPHLLRSLEIRRQLLGPQDLATASSEVAVADLRFEHEGNVGDSLVLLRSALASLRSAGLGDTIAEAWLQLDVGIVCLAGDRLAEAETSFERCRRILCREHGEENVDVSRPLRGLAMVALFRGDIDGADALAREAVMLCKGERAEYIGARATLVLAKVALAAGRLEECAARLDEAARQFTKTVGEEHIRIAELSACRAELGLKCGDFRGAELAARATEALRRRLLHGDHGGILEARLLVQCAQLGLGQVEAGEAALGELAVLAERTAGADHRLTIRVARARVECATAAGDVGLRTIREERLADLVERRRRRLGGQD